MNAKETIEPVEYLGRGSTANKQSLGAILVTSGKITPADADRVMELQRREGWRFGEGALRLRLISEKDLVQALHRQYDLPQLPSDRGPMGDELVAAHFPNDRRTEQLRVLRTHLLTRWLKNDNLPQARKVLAVVSPGNGEGRSYVAANLAVLFAQLGERTLLIDGDMRQPTQHRIFNIEDRIGLSAVLAGRADSKAAQAIPGVRNLRVLPAGAPPPNPLELLSRPMLPQLLDEYLCSFDVILVDTPAALPYSDAHAIGFGARNALVIARKDHTRIADTTRIARDLGTAGTHVVGTVINSY